MAFTFFNDEARAQYDELVPRGLTAAMVESELGRSRDRAASAAIIRIAASRNFIEIPARTDTDVKRVTSTANQVAMNVVAARKALARLEQAAGDVDRGFAPTARRIEDLETAMNDVLAAVRHLERGVTLTIIRAEDAGIVPAKDGGQ